MTLACSVSLSRFASGLELHDAVFADARARAATVTERNYNENFIRPRRAFDAHAEGVDVIERPRIVLLAERDVDRRSSRADLLRRRNDRLPAANRGAHRLAHPRMQHGGGMFHVAVHANDRGLA